MPIEQRNAAWKPVGLAVFFVFQLWLAHAVGYLVHEYAHSFTAWAFRYKANPLALDYGHLNFNNIVFLDDIDENVDYDPIFAAGRGWIASVIAVAGVLIGNGLCYLLSRYGYTRAKQRGKRMPALFLYLLCMMNVGNFLSYVPNRTFATHADMATVERGLHASPWWIAIVLGVPFAIAIWHFFARILPDAERFLFPWFMPGQIFLAIFSAYVVFYFFGSSGFHRYGDISHWLATACRYILFPLTVFLCWPKGSGSAAV